MKDALEDRPTKRRKLSVSGHDIQTNNRDSPSHSTLERSISPPPSRRSREVNATRLIASPFQLTTIRDLPPSSNAGAVSLKDILGDPLIAECWEFNYLHDLDFLMESFDGDVRDMIRVHVIHGFWKKEDESRQRLQVSNDF